MNKPRGIDILYCLFIANYVFSESQLIEYSAIDIFLTVSRYAIVGLLFIVVFRKTKSRITKRYFWLWIVLGGSIFINMFAFSGGVGLLLNIVVVISLYYSHREVRDLISLSIKTLWICNGIVVMLCMIGILEDRTNIRFVGSNFLRFYDGTSLRHTFGFLVQNQIPLTLLVTYILLIIFKRDKIKLYEHVFVAILNVVFLFLFGSRITILMLLAIMIAYYFARKISLRAAKKKKKDRKVCFLWLIYPICLCFSIIVAVRYNPSNHSWQVANNVLMNRLVMSQVGIRTYGITLFGSGNTITGLSVEGLKSATIDNGYINILLRRGIIISVIVIAAWAMLTFRAEKQGNFYLVFCLSALAITNLIDAHLTSYKLIPLFVLMLQQYSEIYQAKFANARYKERIRPLDSV